MASKISGSGDSEHLRIINFELQFQDPVTLELFVDPVVTRCGHIFSKTVLEKLIQNKQYSENTGVAPCPLCRTRIVNNGWTSVPIFNELLNEIKKHGFKYVPVQNAREDLSIDESSYPTSEKFVESEHSKKPIPSASTPPSSALASVQEPQTSQIIKISNNSYEIHFRGRKIPFSQSGVPSSVVRLRAEAFLRHLESNPNVLKAYEDAMEKNLDITYGLREGLKVATEFYGTAKHPWFRQITFEKNEQPPEKPKPVIRRTPARTNTYHRRDNSDPCILI